MSSVNSTSSTSSSSLLRITGMATGIDTDSTVKAMVSSYQTKIDKAEQAKQLLQWKQEAYRDIIKGVKELQDYFDPLSDKYILSDSSFNTNSVTNTDSSIVSVTSSSSAKTGTYKVNVQQLAEQAKIDGDPKNSMILITDFNASNLSNKKLNFGSKGVELKDVTGTGSTLVANINSKIASSDLSGKVTATYVKDGTGTDAKEYIKFTKISSDTTDLTLDMTDNSSNTTSKKINSGISSSTKVSDLNISNTSSFDISYGSTTKTISISSTDTLQSIADEVNSQTSGAVTMSIDDNTGNISFQTKSYGYASSIKISSLTGDASKLGISGSKSFVTGKDAIVSITAPGQSAVTTTQSSNKFTTNGVTYSLVSEGTTTSTITSDTDKVVTNIKNFIDDYNTVIDTINTKLTEKKDSDYPPLTDAQKEEMSEDQITTWETKAKVGVLRNDDLLSGLMTQLRGVFSSSVYSNYDSASSTTNTKISLSFGNYGTNAIGIDTSTDVTDGGQLVLKDETKLKEAIENNLDDLKKMFIGTTDNDDLASNKRYIGSSNYMEDGLFTRMDTILRQYVAAPGLGEAGTYTLSGSMNIFVNKQYDYSSTGTTGRNTLPDQVYKQTLNISKFETQMSDAETRYYTQFAALESAMNTLNSQQSALSSLLGSS